MNKEEKKEHKLHRSDWIEDMHRAAPNVDWKKIDRETRDKKNQKRIKSRGQLLGQGLLKTNIEIIEEIAGGQIKGVWKERGSNNQSGRIHTADVDIDRNLIYRYIY